MNNFDQIYELQEKHQSFSTPQEMLTSLGLFNLTQISAYDYFQKLGLDKLSCVFFYFLFVLASCGALFELSGVGDLFMKELIDGASRCNYLQDGTLNSFTDLISLAGIPNSCSQCSSCLRVH